MFSITSGRRPIFTWKPLARKEINKKAVPRVWSVQIWSKLKSMSLLHGNCFSRWRLRLSYIPNISRRHLRIARHRFSPNEGSKSWAVYPVTVLVLGGAGWVAFENVQTFRHSVLATVRCSRVAGESRIRPAVTFCEQ